MSGRTAKGIAVSTALFFVIVVFNRLPIPSTEASALEEGSIPSHDVQFVLDIDTDPLSFFFNEKWARIPEGSRAMYWVLVQNLGHVNDTYLIELSEPPRNRGWDWYFKDAGGLEARIDLTSPLMRDLHGGMSTRHLLVEVICPPDSVREYEISIEVTAVSERDVDILGEDAPVDTDRVRLIIVHVDHDHTTLWKDRIVYVDPGEWVTLPFELSNYGSRDVIDVDVWIDEMSWGSSYRDFEEIYLRREYLLDYEWTSARISIPKGEKVSKDIRVRVSDDFDGGEFVYRFRALGRMVDTNIWISTGIVTLIVKGYARIDVDVIGGGPISMTPGNDTEVELLISNTGHALDRLEQVRLVDHGMFEIEAFDDSGGPVEGIEIPSMGNVTIRVRLSTDEMYPPGPMDIEVMLRTSYFSPVVVPLRLDIQRTTRMKLLPTDPMRSGVDGLKPGKSARLVFGVRNEGNSPENVTISLSGRRPDWVPAGADPDIWSVRPEWISRVRDPAYFTEEEILEEGADRYIGHLIPAHSSEGPLQLRVIPGETLWVSFEVTSPHGYGIRMIPPTMLEAVLSGEKGTSLDSFEVLMEVRYPDLAFADPPLIINGEGDETFRAGDTVHLSLNVTNVGKAFSDATSISVRSNGREIAEIPIPPLAPGEISALSANFTAYRGMGNIELHIDPDNAVIESNDQFMQWSDEGSNVFEVKIELDEDEGPPWGILVSFILLVLILTAAFLILPRLRRR